MRPHGRGLFPSYMCSLCVSFALVICGSVLLFVWPSIFEYLLRSQLLLAPNSKTFDLWKENPMPMTIDFYFFNWTNPEDVYNSSVKPKLEQVGPYRFVETKEKSNITWNTNGTVTFRHLKKWWVMDDADSKYHLSDPITTLNPIALTAAYKSRDWNFIIKKGISISFRSMIPHINMTRTAGQMLFEGYEDPLIKLGKSMPVLAGQLPPWDRFGWFYTRNGSTDYEGTFNMGTGAEDTVFGRLYNWNDKPRTIFYEGTCSEISGSAGEFFLPNPTDSISLFSSDMCRTMKLDYKGNTLVSNIIGREYSIGTSLLDNGTLVPENKCFCDGECVPSGAVNVSTCRFGSPSFASLPHFYNGDPYYLSSVDGLEPDAQKHKFSIILEPNTGVPLEVMARLQINLLLQPFPSISLFEKVPSRVFFPMLWFEQRVKIPDDLAFQLKFFLNLPTICTSIAIVCLFLGVILMCCSLYKVYTVNACGKQRKMFKFQEQTVPLNKKPNWEVVKMS